MDFLMLEANKCLKCKNARCTKNCPIGTPIPEVIALFEQGNKEAAAKLLFENNPLSAICAYICPHERQCSGNCVKGIKGEPVAFQKIEAKLSSGYLHSLELEKPIPNGKKVAIVGSGPAGITGALRLASKGYYVTMYEVRTRIGGALRYAIPEFRLEPSLIDKLEQLLLSLGVHIKTNTMVGPVITIDKLLDDGYDAVYIATGVWNPRTLDIKGETLGHVTYAINYLKAPKTFNMKGKVCVIGAGDVAMDAARCAKRYGASEVSILYRGSVDQMSATKHEIHGAKDDGIEFIFNRAPMEITEKGMYVQTTQQEEMEDGRLKLTPVENSKEFLEFDNILIAVSQSAANNIVSNTKGLETKYGLLVTDQFASTTRPGVFATGDVVSGAKTVVLAVANAKIAVEGIERFCYPGNY
ncbi:MAG: NAD(P)-dependent oxidoreductase [Bacillota bacterium]